MSRDDAEAGRSPHAPTVDERQTMDLAGSHRPETVEDSHPVADLVARATDLVEPIKPKLRGWLHAGMVPASLAAGIVLICLTRTPQAALACTVYAVTAWLLFGTSAVYHLGTWGPLGEAILRRLDHANIFLIIAGTSTPLAVLLLSADQRSVLLWIVWTGALAASPSVSCGSEPPLALHTLLPGAGLGTGALPAGLPAQRRSGHTVPDRGRWASLQRGRCCLRPPAP